MKKIRKIYRILFPINTTGIPYFENQLANNSNIKSFQKTADFLYEITLNSNKKIYLRNQNHSDYEVFKQIFNFEEYRIILNLITLNTLNDSTNIIIDAGANVGYTTVYFKENLINTKIYAVEPSQSNAEIFYKNTKSYLAENIKLYINALSDEKDKLFIIKQDFRDGKDWSISTAETKNGQIKGITIDEIISENNLEYITFLKIDIEGAERFIFKKENQLSFLKITKIIALEIHDEFNIRTTINQLLAEHNFILFEAGELTIGINKTFF